MLALLNFWQNKSVLMFKSKELKSFEVLKLEIQSKIKIKIQRKIKRKIKPRGLAVFIVLFVAQPIFAAVDLNKNDVDYNEVARVRGYPGGNQEEDLKVQEVLIEPVQTVYKSNADEEIIKEFQKQRGLSKESSKDVGNN